MPHDLIRYRAEYHKIPKQIMMDAYAKLADYSVHLMPLARNAYYTKEMTVFEEGQSSQSSYEFDEDQVNDKAYAFNKESISGDPSQISGQEQSESYYDESVTL